MKQSAYFLASITAFITLFATAPLQAGVTQDSISVQNAPAADDGWEFTLSPYAWAAGLNGSVGIGNVVSEVDLSFGDILENLDIGAMLHFEARKGRWAFLFDGFWLKLDADADTPGPLFSGANVEVEELRLAALVSYRVLEGSTTLDLLAGASYFSIDTELNLLPGQVSAASLSQSEDWVDPVIGFHLRHEHCERWFTMLRGEVGGFDLGSDLTWQVMGGVGYRVGESSDVFFGYRHLKIDYSENNFTYDTETSSFILGMNFFF